MPGAIFLQRKRPSFPESGTGRDNVDQIDDCQHAIITVEECQPPDAPTMNGPKPAIATTNCRAVEASNRRVWTCGRVNTYLIGANELISQEENYGEGNFPVCHRGHRLRRYRRGSSQCAILSQQADQNRRAVPSGRTFRRRGPSCGPTADCQIGANRHHRKSAGRWWPDRREGCRAVKSRWLYAAIGRYEPQCDRIVDLQESQLRTDQRLYRGRRHRRRLRTPWS